DGLPARGRLAGERARGDQRAGRAPKVGHVAAGVGAALVEAEPGDVAGRVGAELEPQLDWRGRRDRWHGRRGRVGPDAARAGAQLDGDGDAGARTLEVAAVVDRAALDRRRAGRGWRPA